MQCSDTFLFRIKVRISDIYLKKYIFKFSAKKCSPVELNRDSMDTPNRPPTKGLVFDEGIQLTPYAQVTVYRYKYIHLIVYFNSNKEIQRVSKNRTFLTSLDRFIKKIWNKSGFWSSTVFYKIIFYIGTPFGCIFYCILKLQPYYKMVPLHGSSFCLVFF